MQPHKHAEVTDWFPGDVKPVRPGVYETDSRWFPSRCFQFWDGVKWGFASRTPEIAYAYAGTTSMRQDDAWRGLAADIRPHPADEQTDDATGIVEVSE